VNAASEALQRRVRELRSRAAVRRWEMRQLDRAGGAWFRVARVLAYARRAWTISEEDTATLLAAGHVPDRAGMELEPPRRLFFLSEEQVASLSSARPVKLTASPDLLAHRALVLVPFPGLLPDRAPSLPVESPNSSQV